MMVQLCHQMIGSVTGRSNLHSEGDTQGNYLPPKVGT